MRVDSCCFETPSSEVDVTFTVTMTKTPCDLILCLVGAFAFSFGRNVGFQIPYSHFEHGEATRSCLVRGILRTNGQHISREDSSEASQIRHVMSHVIPKWNLRLSSDH